MDRDFPIQRIEDSQVEQPTSIPWGLLNERRADLNHGQTLEELARRGGLSVTEALAVALDRPWERLEVATAVERLEYLVERFWLVRSLKPGIKVYADLRGMGIAGRLVSFDKTTGKALVNFHGCDGIQETSLDSVTLYDET